MIPPLRQCAEGALHTQQQHNQLSGCIEANRLQQDPANNLNERDKVIAVLNGYRIVDGVNEEVSTRDN